MLKMVNKVIKDVQKFFGNALKKFLLLSLFLSAQPFCHAQALAELANNAPILLDNFADLTPWKTLSSDGIISTISAANDFSMAGMTLHYDFGHVAGYAALRRKMTMNLPDNYEISFYIRGDASPNTFQIKLLDASGDNVWWYQKKDYVFPQKWQLIRIKKRQIEFAWGTTKDKTLKHVDQIEFVVNKTANGGQGHIQIANLTLRALPPADMPYPTPLITTAPTQSTPIALGSNGELNWHATSATNSQLQIDFGRPKEFGALVLEWQKQHRARHYYVDFSDDGVNWTTVRDVNSTQSDRQALLLTESETRYLRIRIPTVLTNVQKQFELKTLHIEPLEYGQDVNHFLMQQAQVEPLGQFPRGFSGQQSYWTIIGNDGGSKTALLGEDGAIELYQGGISVEPFVELDNKIVTWADVKTSQTLQDDYLPIPSAHWHHPQFKLDVTSFAIDKSMMFSRYEITNSSDTTEHLKLILAARPMQVNPPAQFLNIAGGYTPISQLNWQAQHLEVNGDDVIYPLNPPSSVKLSTFDDGITPAQILSNPQTDKTSIKDDNALASDLLVYDITLAPHAHQVIGIATRLEGHSPFVFPTQNIEHWLDANQQQVATLWRHKLNEVQFKLPQQGKKLHDAVRSALAQILIMRDGAALQPGTRSYARSWIRDGAMMAEALLRLGRTDTAKAYANWFAPYQFANGKTPCCVDKRGSDPVPENDSHGEFIFLTEQLYRYTHDAAQLQNMWPKIKATMTYMEGLRQSERSAINQTPENRANYGLMPASISHEGYSDKPMHSYWDDFWALRGYKDAVSIAATLGKTDDVAQWTNNRDQFKHDIYASIDNAMTAHNMRVIPGCAELGDFDATSLTVALSPANEQQNLPPQALQASFERYWDEFVQRRDGKKTWDVYTPYELRTVASFIRLGWRDRAQELLDFFYAGQRPNAWNQWGEVVAQDPKKIIFVGDMPHGWIASDYIRSALDMFAYEREMDNSLVLAAGIPASWLSTGEALSVHQLRTTYGALSYDLKQRANITQLHIAKGINLPKGGLVFMPPPSLITDKTVIKMNGKQVKQVAQHGEGIRIKALPALVELVN